MLLCLCGLRIILEHKVKMVVIAQSINFGLCLVACALSNNFIGRSIFAYAILNYTKITFFLHKFEY